MRRQLHIAHDLDASPIVRHRIKMKRSPGNDVLRRSQCLFELCAIEAQRFESDGFALGMSPHERKQLIAR